MRSQATTRRDFLKGCGMLVIAKGLSGMAPALWTCGCGSEEKNRQSLPESFTSYETTPSAAHRVLAERHSSVLLLGPPPSEDLLALVTHLYTREAAELAVRFPNKIYATLSELVRVTGKPPEEIQDILRPVVQERHVILELDRILSGMAGYGWVDDLRRVVFDWYSLIRPVAKSAIGVELPERPEEIFESTTYLLSPIIPPMFEANFMSGLLSAWHKRYAMLFTRVFETGYMRSYIRDHEPVTVLRTIPIEESLDSRLQIVDEDRLSTLLDQVGDVVLVACQGPRILERPARPQNRPLCWMRPVSYGLFQELLP